MSLHFPSRESIVSYLKQHPLTSKKIYSYLTEEKIIDAVADCFANQDKVSTGVNMDIIKTLVDLNLEIPKNVFTTIYKNLTQALNDCAKGKTISIEKRTQ